MVHAAAGGDTAARRVRRILGPTRVAFVDVPRLLRDLIVGLLPRDLSVEPDPAVLDDHDVFAVIESGRVNVLIIAGPRFSDPERICRLLESCPHLKTLVVLDEGRRAAFYELRARRETGELTSATLARLLEAAQRNWVDLLGDT